MGALYHLKQKLVDFCNVIQENVSRTDTVPSSKVVYDLKADTDSQISALNDSLTNCMIVKGYTATYSINANEAKGLSVTDFGITAIPGYYAYAIVGIIPSNQTYNITVGRFVAYSLSQTTLVLKNNSNSAYSNSVASIYVLWVKNGFIKSE